MISQQRPFHALITGGSRGIGLSIAQLLASRSYRCTLISRDAGTLSTALKSLDPLPSHFDAKYAHSVIPGDVSSSAFWSYPKSKGPTTETSSSSSSSTTTNESSKDDTSGPRIFGSYLQRPDSNTSDNIGKIDIVVHCAGITQSSLHTRTSPEDMQRLIATNLTSIMLANRFLMRFGYFKGGGQQEQRNGGPVIIHVASLLGVKGGFGASAYAASKAGLIGFTRALASEYGTHGCRVNAVVPGYIGTSMTSDLNDKHLNSMIPLGRFGTPEEVAHAVLFLVQNQYAHNCILNLDGGLSAT